MKKAAVPSILIAVVLLALGVIAEAQQVRDIPSCNQGARERTHHAGQRPD